MIIVCYLNRLALIGHQSQIVAKPHIWPWRKLIFDAPSHRDTCRGKEDGQDIIQIFWCEQLYFAFVHIYVYDICVLHVSYLCKYILFNMHRICCLLKSIGLLAYSSDIVASCECKNSIMKRVCWLIWNDIFLWGNKV